MANTNLIEIVLIAVTLAIAGSMSYALWQAQRIEPTQLRRVICLAMYGAFGVFVSKLIELALLTSVGSGYASAVTVYYGHLAADTIVVLGFTLLAVSVLDIVALGRHVWSADSMAPKQQESRQTKADSSDSEPSDFDTSMVPAVLFRRSAPFSDTKTTSEFLTNGFEGILGFSREELQSDPHFLTWLMHPKDRQLVLSGDNDLEPGQLEAVFDQRFKHRSGSYRWIRTCVRRIEGENGQLKELIGCGFDITEQKEAEEQLSNILSTDPCNLVFDDELA